MVSVEEEEEDAHLSSVDESIRFDSGYIAVVVFAAGDVTRSNPKA